MIECCDWNWLSAWKKLKSMIVSDTCRLQLTDTFFYSRQVQIIPCMLFPHLSLPGYQMPRPLHLLHTTSHLPNPLHFSETCLVPPWSTHHRSGHQERKSPHLFRYSGPQSTLLAVWHKKLQVNLLTTFYMDMWSFIYTNLVWS